jgi:hypothetical protein
MHPRALCSAQTAVFPRKMLVYALEDFVCRGVDRIHNPKVGSSSLSPPLPIESTTYSGQKWPLFVTVGKTVSVYSFSICERVHGASQATVRRVRVAR